MHIMTGINQENILTLLSMKMETPKKNNVRHTYTTLKECLEDPNWEKAYDIILRNLKYRLKNHCYE